MTKAGQRTSDEVIDVGPEQVKIGQRLSDLRKKNNWTLESVSKTRVTLTFIDLSSTYQGLVMDSGAMSSSSLTAFVSRKTRKPT